jgi:uncharacterized protein
MATFKITAIDPRTLTTRTLLYGTESSTLTDENFISVVPRVSQPVQFSHFEKNPIGKADIKTLKIQLGLSCNFSCEYCNQRFVPHAEETHQEEARQFIAGMDAWLTSPPAVIEFWGGEPFVYWKTFRPLAEALRVKFPEAKFTVITNGSIVDDEKVDWLDRLNFHVGLSHDGPGQSVRGPDPLQDTKTRTAILALYRRLAPKQRFSFNAMVNRSNTSRAAIQRFFEELVAPDEAHLVIGEGAFIDAYDQGGAAQSLDSQPEEIAFRNRAFHEIRAGAAARFNSAVRERVASFVNSLRINRPLSAVQQKCGMDRRDNIAVDLRGNVLTCQNTSHVAHNPAGVSHHLGHVSNLAAVEMKTATHWTDREECPKCPMIQICKGACFFLSGPLWGTTCNNAYSDAVPIFAAGIEFLTGLLPVHIEGDFREDRKDIFGLVHIAEGGHPTTEPRKPFPVPVVRA